MYGRYRNSTQVPSTTVPKCFTCKYFTCHTLQVFHLPCRYISIIQMFQYLLSFNFFSACHTNVYVSYKCFSTCYTNVYVSYKCFSTCYTNVSVSCKCFSTCHTSTYGRYWNSTHYLYHTSVSVPAIHMLYVWQVLKHLHDTETFVWQALKHLYDTDIFG